MITDTWGPPFLGRKRRTWDGWSSWSSSAISTAATTAAIAAAARLPDLPFTLLAPHTIVAAQHVGEGGGTIVIRSRVGTSLAGVARVISGRDNTMGPAVAEAGADGDRSIGTAGGGRVPGCASGLTLSADLIGFSKVH